MYGQVDPYYWRVYAGPNEQDRDGACFGMWDAGPRGGGGGSACGSSPFFTSGSETPHMVYGIVTSAAATVSVEHAGAPPESFPAIAGDGFRVKFFAGVVATQPITRLVAYDKSGKQVAEDTQDVIALNSGP